MAYDAARRIGGRSVSGIGSFEDLANSARYDVLQFHPCSPLWSAKITHETADKRNEWALDDCLGELSDYGDLQVSMARKVRRTSGNC